jgi:hypothetical protein
VLTYTVANQDTTDGRAVLVAKVSIGRWVSLAGVGRPWTDNPGDCRSISRAARFAGRSGPMCHAEVRCPLDNEMKALLIALTAVADHVIPVKRAHAQFCGSQADCAHRIRIWYRGFVLSASGCASIGYQCSLNSGTFRHHRPGVSWIADILSDFRVSLNSGRGSFSLLSGTGVNKRAARMRRVALVP